MKITKPNGRGGTPQPGKPEPRLRAVDLAWPPAYVRDGSFAVEALSGRVPEARPAAEAMDKVYKRPRRAVRPTPQLVSTTGHRARQSFPAYNAQPARFRRRGFSRRKPGVRHVIYGPRGV